MDPLPALPEYHLEQEIGGGPLTRVFRARHRAGQFPCALKLLRESWSTDPNARSLLANEARVGLAVRHAHLVRMFDARPNGPLPFVVMELLEGESLGHRILRNYSLDQSTAVRVARQVAEAISVMHRAGFVHGDVNPTNIWLIELGTAVLTGLGQSHRPGELPTLRRSGFFLGTPGYGAPELLDPAADHSLASDWFSFGLTLAEMLTGEILDLSEIRESGVRAWVEDYGEGWPGSLQDLVFDLLNPRPTRRPLGSAVVNELRSIEGQVTRPRLRRAA